MTTTTQTATILWSGKSGNKYKYWIHPIETQFVAQGGNYIFAKRDALGRWIPVYIGQTENLADRFADHHAMPCIHRNGATHVHAHTQPSKTERLSEETDLIANWNTACNLT